MSTKGKIPQWEVIVYSALDTGNVYDSEQIAAFTFKEPIFNLYKIRLFSTHMYG